MTQRFRLVNMFKFLRNSMVGNHYIAQSDSLEWAGHRGVRLWSGQDIAQSDSGVGRTPQSQTLQWAGHRRVRLWSGQDIAQSDSRVGRTPHSQTLQWAGHRTVRL